MQPAGAAEAGSGEAAEVELRVTALYRVDTTDHPVRADESQIDLVAAGLGVIISRKREDEVDRCSGDGDRADFFAVFKYTVVVSDPVGVVFGQRDRPGRAGDADGDHGAVGITERAAGRAADGQRGRDREERSGFQLLKPWSGKGCGEQTEPESDPAAATMGFFRGHVSGFR